MNSLLWDLIEEFSDVRLFDDKNLSRTMKDIYNQKRIKDKDGNERSIPFVILIDEWDCIFREHSSDKEAQKKYLDFIRNWLKDKNYVALAYMTGILPIKKYGQANCPNIRDLRKKRFRNFVNAIIKIPMKCVTGTMAIRLTAVCIYTARNP